MELPKNSFEQCSFQKKREISKDIGSSVAKDQSKTVIESASYVPYHDLISSSASIQEEVFDRKADVILLEQEPASLRVIDSDSKIILPRQFGEMAEQEKSNLQSDVAYCENMKILRKLPPDTVVIRQQARASKEDSDYRELMETNSSGSSSTSGCTAVKAKRFTRAIRKKTRETVEVRRNPMRVSKKTINKDFPRSKRLLVNSRREMCTNYEPIKRIKSSTMPYMKTRSVTRKMFTVGATYQAPTKKDETEWKEWPVHGMHERPVYHPQAGLAVEYLGRYFTSLDGLSNYEIIEPEIEVVAVDPHRDQRAPSVEKKSKGKARGKDRCSNVKDACDTYFFAEDKSFETCMHGSFHCVLGYCSQIMSPAYKQAVEEKMKLTVSTPKTIASETSAKTTVMNNLTSCSENVPKFGEKAKFIEAIAIAQNVQKKNIINNTNGRRTALVYPSSSGTYVPERAQRSIAESDGSKIIPQSGEMIRMNLKRILRDASNNSLILLRNSAAKTTGEDCTAIAKDVFNPAKLEDMSVDDKAPTNMSVYKKLVLAGEPALGREESPVKNNLYTLKRYSSNTRENTVKKIFVENQLENIHAAKENHKGRNVDKIKINRESNAEMLMMNSGKNSTQCASETSEIARILSEYNNSTLRKSTMHNRIYDSRNMKANMANSSAKALPRDLWQKNTSAEENQNFIIPDVNADLDLSQEKWQRYNLTLGEKTKDNETVNSTQTPRNSCSISLENNQVPFTDRQMSLNTLKHVREKSAKSCKERESVTSEAKSQEEKSEDLKDKEIQVSATEPLQELLENTAILYCAANGIHQDDLSNYIDTLDSKQSIQWLESWNNSVV
ncbi:uncharacterized protein [Anoplolepis gracilipes]|uniref:uncharacterized protein n=1 Tax=Anoplolepis gracilipes TaxID=354296 RepID=UPI003BA06A53